MTRMVQSNLGRDFIDVLEEAVLRHRPIAVELEDGSTFIDEVEDVVTENGQEFAVFRVHSRVALGQIRAVTRDERKVH